MPNYRKQITLPNNLNRKLIRKHVVECFLEEDAGTGKGDLASKYIYDVEVCANRIIYISRPATLNKGMDFTVHVENVTFRPKYAFKDRPKHDEIIADLEAKKHHDRATYQKISQILKQIYLCEDIDREILHSININAGLLTCEEVCLVIKWLFIEQDVTYWNWSGRAMFYNALYDKGLID